MLPHYDIEDSAWASGSYARLAEASGAPLHRSTRLELLSVSGIVGEQAGKATPCGAKRHSRRMLEEAHKSNGQSVAVDTAFGLYRRQLGSS